MLARRLILLSLLALGMPALAAAQPLDTAPEQRADTWQVARPSEAGLDPHALAELTQMIDAGITFPNVHALLITRADKLVYEHYWPGEDWLLTGEALGVVAHGPESLHDIRSVSKSVTSLLLGIALGGADDAALARPIASFFADRDLPDTLDTITLHHVLTMTAGLAWNETIVPYTERNDFVRLFNSEDPVGFVLGKDLRDTPGTRWSYNTGLTELMAGVIEGSTRQSFEAFADQALFAPLGITDYAWHMPEAWGQIGIPSAGGGLRLRARDMAKIGALVLQGGVWDEQQVVPADWIEASTTRHVKDTPWGPPGVYGYGYFWFPGTLLSGHEVIRAVGYGDQRIFVVPEVGLVVTVFAGNHQTPGSAVGERILGRVLRALE